MRSTLIFFALLLSTELRLSAAESSPTSGLDRIRRNGKVVMLVFPQQVSRFVSVDLDQGVMPRVGGIESFRGFDVDLMASFARSLGVHLEIRVSTQPSYAALIPDLLAGQGDVIGCGFSITDERKKVVDFSDPYLNIFPVVVTRNGSDIGSLADLKTVVGVAVSGSSQEERLRKFGLDGPLLRRVDFTIEAVGEVIDGQADYLLLDSTVALTTLSEQKDLKMAFRLDENHGLGYALPPGSDLLPELNRFLAAAERSGELERLRQKYFSDHSALAIRWASEPAGAFN